MKAALALLLHCTIGVTLTLLSTFVGERSALAVYPEIMGCENGCAVVATGWPFVFVSDYLGMSVANTADILEVWFAADRFSTTPFLGNVAVWAMASVLVTRLVLRRTRSPSPLARSG